MSDTDATIGYNANGSALNIATLSGQASSALNVMNLYGSGSAGNSGDSFRDINPSNSLGKLWLIGASFTTPNPDGWYKKSDGFKIEYLTYTTPTPTPQGGVPEPSTWAMMLLGFFGLGGAMRSSRRRERAEHEALSEA